MPSSDSEGRGEVSPIQDALVDAWNDSPAAEPPTAVASEQRVKPIARSTTTTKPSALPSAGGVKSKVAAAVGVPATGGDVTASWVPLLLALAGFAMLSGIWDVIDTTGSGPVGSVTWRFAAVGGSARALGKPLVSCILITMALLSSDRVALAKVVSWTFMLATVLFITLIPFFLLDAFQIRPALSERLSGQTFSVNVAFAVVHLIAAAVVLFRCGWSLRTWVSGRTESVGSAIQESWQK